MAPENLNWTPVVTLLLTTHPAQLRYVIDPLYYSPVMITEFTKYLPKIGLQNLEGSADHTHHTQQGS